MDLLKNALDIIQNLLNSHLNIIDQRQDQWVLLSSLVGHDGAVNNATQNKIVMCVYNITREAFSSTYNPVMTGYMNDAAGNGYSTVAPPLYLDVHLMFMANFPERSYPDGLAALSRVISYFQQTPVFTPQNAPGLAPEITKLTLDIENLTPVDVNYVMSMLGTRYLPSAFYKLRMIPFASSAMQGRAFPIETTSAGVSV